MRHQNRKRQGGRVLLCMALSLLLAVTGALPCLTYGEEGRLDGQTETGNESSLMTDQTETESGAGAAPGGAEPPVNSLESQTDSLENEGIVTAPEAGSDAGLESGSEQEDSSSEPDGQIDIPLVVLRSLGQDTGQYSGPAALEDVVPTAGTLIWRNKRCELIVPRDQESFSLIAQPMMTSSTYAPTVKLTGAGADLTLPVNRPSEPVPIGIGDYQEYTIVSTPSENLSGKVCSYSLVVFRTDASFTFEVSDAVLQENGKRGFYIDCVANGAFSLNNLQLALTFDPQKLAVARYDNYNAIGSDPAALAVSRLRERGGFLDLDEDGNGAFAIQSEGKADNAKGVFQLPFGNTTSKGYTTTEGEGLFRLFFQIRQEEGAFDQRTLQLAVKQSGVVPQTGISCSQPVTEKLNFISGTPEMAVFSGLDKLYQKGDETLPGGYVLDTSEPYAGDTLLTVSNPYREDGSAYGKDENASTFVNGTGVTFSEAEAALNGLVEGEMTEAVRLPAEEGAIETPEAGEGQAKGGKPGADQEPMDEGVVPGSQVLRFEPTLRGPESPLLSGSQSDSGVGATAAEPAVGEERTFQTLDMAYGGSYKPATFICLGMSEHVCFWGETGNETLANLTAEQLETLKTECETNYDYLSGRFGGLADKNGDGRLDVLFYDIQDGFGVGGQTGYYQGIFDASELFYAVGNDRDVLHLDTWPTMGGKTNPNLSAVLSTFVHEGQHLAFASDVKRRGITLTVGNQQRYTPTWINEGLSMTVEHERYGVLNSRIGQFNRSATIPTGQTALGRWGSGASVDDYALTYLFFQYVTHQAETAGITDLPTSFYRDYEVEGTMLEEILRRIPAFEGKSAREIWQDFFLALYMLEPEGVYGFCGDGEFDGVKAQVLEKTPSTVRAGGAVFSKITDPAGFIPEDTVSDRLLFAGITDSEETATFSATVNEPLGGTVTISPQKDSYSLGESVRITASAQPGWRFVGWGGDVPESQKKSETAVLYMRGAKTAAAVFAEIVPVSLRVTADPAEGGIVRVSPEPGESGLNSPRSGDGDETAGSGVDGIYEKGTKITLTAEPREGWRFAGYLENGTLVSEEAAYVFSLEAARELTAAFERLAYLPDGTLDKLFPQKKQEGTELALTSGGAMRLTTEKGSLTLTSADGTPFTDLGQIPIDAVARAEAEASGGNQLLGIRVTKLAASRNRTGVRNESSMRNGLLMQSGSLKTGLAQTGSAASIAVRPGSQDESLELLTGLAGGEAVILTGENAFLPLLGYSAEAVFTSASGDDSYESLNLAKLTVETPEGRELVRRQNSAAAGGAGERADPRFGFTGSVKEYDLYLLSGETELTLQPWIFDETFTVTYSYGSQTDVAVGQLPAEVGGDFQRLAPVMIPVSQSGDGMDPVVFTVTHTAQGGTITSETCTIHLRRAASESEDPVTRLELVQKEGTQTAEVTVKLRKATLGGVRFTLDLAGGMKLSDGEGRAFEPGGGLSSYLTAGGIALTGSGLELLEVTGVQYQTVSTGGIAGGSSASGSALRLSVTLAPKEPLSAGGAAFDEDTAVLTFFLSNPGGAFASDQIALAEDKPGAGQNVNVIYDYNWGELWNRTKLVDLSTLLKVTGTFQAWHSAFSDAGNAASPSAWMPRAELSVGGERIQAGVTEKETAPGTYAFGLREFIFEAEVPAGQTSGITISKAAHADLNISGVEVSTANVSGGAVNVNELLRRAYGGKTDASSAPELQLAAEGILRLAAGDVTGDGRINLEDKNVLMSPLYYGKSTPVTSEGTGGTGGSNSLRGPTATAGYAADPAALCDLDGDGRVTLADLNILMSPYNYGKGGRRIVIPANTGEGD